MLGPSHADTKSLMLGSSAEIDPLANLFFGARLATHTQDPTKATAPPKDKFG